MAQDSDNIFDRNLPHTFQIIKKWASDSCLSEYRRRRTLHCELLQGPITASNYEITNGINHRIVPFYNFHDPMGHGHQCPKLTYREWKNLQPVKTLESYIEGSDGKLYSALSYLQSELRNWNSLPFLSGLPEFSEDTREYNILLYDEHEDDLAIATTAKFDHIPCQHDVAEPYNESLLSSGTRTSEGVSPLPEDELSSLSLNDEK